MRHVHDIFCSLGSGDEVQPLLKQGAASLHSHVTKATGSSRYRFPKIREKGAILMIVWNVLFATALTCTANNLAFGTPERLVVAGLTSLYPVVGWLADCYTGRYHVLKVALYSLLFSILAKGIFLFIVQSSVLHYMASCAWSISAVCYLACIIQFTTDQSVGASGEELSFTVYWLVWGLTTGEFLSRTIPNSFSIDPHLQKIVRLVLSLISFAVACILFENCSHLLMTKPQLSNPIKLIYQVLNYARKNHYPKQRSALTYWEEDYPSRIDLGKNKYGGPFTVEEVEDVKTILRLIPVVLCTMAFAVCLWHGEFLSQFESFQDCVSPPTSRLYFFTNLLQYNSSYFPCMLAAIGIPIYHFIIYPLFYNHIPSMLKRIGIGLFLVFLSFLLTSVAELAANVQSNSTTCMFHQDSASNLPGCYLSIIKQLVNSVGVVMVSYTSFEFFIAQTPWQIKGVMVCMAVQTFGAFTLIGTAMDMLLENFPINVFPGCAFYYYSIYTVLILVIFVLFVCIAKWYRLRKRDDIVPFYLLAEDNFERNYRREQRYLQRMDRDATGVLSAASLSKNKDPRSVCSAP